MRPAAVSTTRCQPPNDGRADLVAEGVGFEPTVGCPTAVFKTVWAMLGTALLSTIPVR